MNSQFWNENQNKPRKRRQNVNFTFISENYEIIPLSQDKNVIVQDSASCDCAFRTSRDISMLRTYLEVPLGQVLTGNSPRFFWNRFFQLNLEDNSDF